MPVSALLRMVAIGAVSMTAAFGAVGPGAADPTPPPTIANETVWKDSAGADIKAQGGNVFKEGDTWYWVGTKMDKSPDPSNPLAKSINLYSSDDLVNWTFEKALVTQSGTTGDLKQGAWLGRPQLIHNPTTGKYIIWAEVGAGLKNSQGESLGNGQGVFVSDTIDGTYTYRGMQLTEGLSSGDRSVFVEGNSAYLVYVGDSAESRNVDLNIAPLSADWLTVQDPIWTGDYGHHEAPGIVKAGSVYYLFASGMDWWAGTPRPTARARCSVRGGPPGPTSPTNRPPTRPSARSSSRSSPWWAQTAPPICTTATATGSSTGAASPPPGVSGGTRGTRSRSRRAFPPCTERPTSPSTRPPAPSTGTR